MPILTAFKYYDAAKYVLDLGFAEIVSVNVVNETWFQSQPADIQAAIREAGRAAEERAFPWGVANVAAANEAWKANGGEIVRLPAGQQEAMMKTFREIGLSHVAAKPEVKAEYDRIAAVARAKAAQ
jgi:TRAP-type C4-dicarboxylate transport system substrate-binding protein